MQGFIAFVCIVRTFLESIWEQYSKTQYQLCSGNFRWTFILLIVLVGFEIKLFSQHCTNCNGHSCIFVLSLANKSEIKCLCNDYIFKLYNISKNTYINWILDISSFSVKVCCNIYTTKLLVGIFILPYFVICSKHFIVGIYWC